MSAVPVIPHFLFQIENLADPENLEIQHNIILALRAHNLMFRDQDYVELPQDKLFLVEHHVISQIIKTKLIVGHIGDVTAVLCHGHGTGGDRGFYRQ